MEGLFCKKNPEPWTQNSVVLIRFFSNERIVL
jgi:hypothetical protein